MPVSLDELLQELPPERRADIERRASALAADYRLTADQAEPMAPKPPLPKEFAIGTKAATGQRCPRSGVWKVENVTSATRPIAIGNLMPPYANRAVTWILIQQV